MPARARWRRLGRGGWQWPGGRGGVRCRPNLRGGAEGPPGIPVPVRGTALRGRGEQPQPAERAGGLGSPAAPGLSLSAGTDTGCAPAQGCRVFRAAQRLQGQSRGVGDGTPSVGPWDTPWKARSRGARGSVGLQWYRDPRPARVTAGRDPPELQADTVPLLLPARVKLCRQCLSSVSLSCLLDEPFSNPLAPEGHDVDDSHSFHQ